MILSSSQTRYRILRILVRDIRKGHQVSKRGEEEAIEARFNIADKNIFQPVHEKIIPH